MAARTLFELLAKVERRARGALRPESAR